MTNITEQIAATHLGKKSGTSDFYDNSLRFAQIAVMRDGMLEDMDSPLPEWFSDMLQEKANFSGQVRSLP